MTRLSYSAWATYDQCPLKYSYSYREKLPRKPPGPPAERGIEIHDGIEAYLNGTNPNPPLQVRHHYGQWLMGLRENPIAPEHKWAVNAAWELVEWGDPLARWRGILDLLHPPIPHEPRVKIYEWKTGSIYDEHANQADLYGIVGLLLHTEVDECEVTNVYVDKRKNVQRHYYRSDLEEMKHNWDIRHTEVTREQFYAPNPTFKCRYCDFSRGSGGPCQF